jgi:PKD repeat protein
MKRNILLSIALLYTVLFVLHCSHDNTVTPTGPEVVVSSVTPNQVGEGAVDVKISIAGIGFTNTSTVDLGPNINILEKDIPNPQTINLKIRVSKNAAPGARTVTVNTGAAVAQLPNGLTVESNRLPVADFTITPSSGTQNVTYAFDASASTDPDGNIVRYDWDFGDGATAHGVTAKHKYSKGGDFTVALTLTDSSSAESTKRKLLRVTFFDRAQAEKEINDVVVEFLTLFGKIETLTAEEITVGFSDSPDCPGKAREINTINQQKPNIREAFVDVYDPATVTNLTETGAHASLAARFYGTYVDGTNYDGVATHDFVMVNEPTGWHICSYTVQ